MSQFEIPPAQTQFNNDAVAETWFEVINSGGYLKNGQPLDSDPNPMETLGFEPLFSVGTINLLNMNAMPVTEIPAPGRGSRGVYLMYPITRLSLVKDIPGGSNYNLGLERPFNNAGDSLLLATDGTSAAGLIAPSTAVYRFTASLQCNFINNAVDLTGSAYALLMVVQRNGTTPSQYICPASAVELGSAQGMLFGNRASIATELALEQGDIVTLFVAWMYSETPLQIYKVLWTGSKLTLDSPAS